MENNTVMRLAQQDSSRASAPQEHTTQVLAGRVCWAKQHTASSVPGCPMQRYSAKTKSTSLKSAPWTRTPHKCDPGLKAPRPNPLHVKPLAPCALAA